MRRSTRNLGRVATTLLAIGALAGLGACGSSDSEEDAVTEALTSALESNDASLCTEAFTQKFVEGIARRSGQAAIETCERSFEGDNSETADVEVSNVEVDGDTATADADFSQTDAGETQEESVSFELVKEEGDWKIDAIAD